MKLRCTDAPLVSDGAFKFGPRLSQVTLIATIMSYMGNHKEVRHLLFNTSIKARTMLALKTKHPVSRMPKLRSGFGKFFTTLLTMENQEETLSRYSIDA